MNIDEAIENVIELIDFYSDEDLEEPIKVIIKEYEHLKREVTKLVIESIKREKELAKMEAEVMYLQNFIKRM